jgi:hypothetical protein
LHADYDTQLQTCSCLDAAEEEEEEEEEGD